MASPGAPSRYQRALAAIRSAEAKAGRAPRSVTLVAVSKTVVSDGIRAVLAEGQRIFGENRVQEAAAKWPALKAAIPDIELHLIGPLQTNKAREAVRVFDVIETLDRPRLAHALKEAMAREGREPRLFVQVNTGGEAQKAGVAPAEVDDLIRLARGELGLRVDGVMCIPPAGEDPAPHFDLLAAIAARNGLKALSMGMTGDFEIAIAHGATHVRLGTAVFGERT